jgi:hypothetical protein
LRGKEAVADGEILLKAAFAGFKAGKTGGPHKVLAAIKAAVPEALPLIESLANTPVPRTRRRH